MVAYDYTCFCNCSQFLSDYNIFDFMQAHPWQFVLASLVLGILICFIAMAIYGSITTMNTQ